MVRSKQFDWVTDEDGSTTILSLFLFMIALVLGGLAIDFNKVVSERTQLQVAADSAAHAALYTRERDGSEAAVAKALETVTDMLPESQFGSTALMTTDVNFGEWNKSELTFSENADSTTAVRVQAMMKQERDNASRNILLRLIGQDTFDVSVESVYSTYFPGCFTEGFVAEGVVDIQSNNSFTDGFCIHSNQYVSMNQNNYFEPGTVVSMPNVEDLDIPKSGFDKNDGLQTALRSGSYRLRLLNQLPDIIESFWSAKAEHLPPYVSSGYYYDVDLKEFPGLPPDEPKPKGNTNSLNPYHFEPNTVNRMSCGGSGKITMDAGLYEQFVFISDCEVKFSNGVILEDVVIATTDTGASSLNSPQGLQIGRHDNCAPGGGATLMTLGGFSAASSLSVHNGQILAMGDIDFAANAGGVKGASFVSYGQIDGTSNMDMGYCQNSGMEDVYRAPYFRMVD
ncbi:Tad domain-containing protein [Sulfitobacter delicatus]|uniref:Putative Tad-like Flp pilus-assembly n=1 Tax=Sulfitobacter delicatus TaxID=218672 RepID=A0A1G7SKY2_9RHOB|nr:Tad domain-containing protein [Sulfitobacter delicatus]SDG23725.1 Putative Tad-like Flp pilus-assembly [Sulfitobacter delicatus]